MLHLIKGAQHPFQKPSIGFPAALPVLQSRGQFVYLVLVQLVLGIGQRCKEGAQQPVLIAQQQCMQLWKEWKGLS